MKYYTDNRSCIRYYKGKCGDKHTQTKHRYMKLLYITNISNIKIRFFFILSIIACAIEHARLCFGKYGLCTTFSVYESLCPNWGYMDLLIILSCSLIRMSNNEISTKKLRFTTCSFRP